MFEDVLAVLGRVDPQASDAARVDQLAALERVKAACAAAQARVTADFAASQQQVAAAWRERARECAGESDFHGWVAAREQARRSSVVGLDVGGDDIDDGGDGAARRRGGGRRGSERSTGARPGTSFGVAGQVALARRESPARGSRHLAMAVALVHRLPRTLAALEVGAVSEWRAEIIVRECAILTSEQQSSLDAELFDTLGVERLSTLGDRELVREVRAIAYRIDAASVLARARGEEQQRRVTIRPAPDTMSYVTAYLPVAQGVAVHAALAAAAASARAGGDERGAGQVMADTLVERVTGQATAGAVPVEVQLVITDQALLTNAFARTAARDVPAQVPGYGTVPAAWARNLLRDSAADVFVRRLYASPEDGTLVAMESHRRTFTGGLRRFLIARDGTCTTPWCDAPIAHLDHITPHAAGGPTSARNARGTCVRCNLTKEHPGWRATVRTGTGKGMGTASGVAGGTTRVRGLAGAAGPAESRAPGDGGGSRPRDGSDPPRVVTLTTPTGHTYDAYTPPLLPGSQRVPEVHADSPDVEVVSAVQPRAVVDVGSDVEVRSDPAAVVADVGTRAAPEPAGDGVGREGTSLLERRWERLLAG